MKNVSCTPFLCCRHRIKDHTGDFHRIREPGDSRRFWFCTACGYSHERVRGRKWRCDFAWPDRRLIVEVEGGVYTQGRHTRGSGFTKDLEKYNALTEAGWKVLRFSRREVTSGEALNVIQRVLNDDAVSG